MSPLEQYLIDTTEYLSSLGLQTFLIGSTLLQLVRTGEFKYRHDLDRELNIGCFDEDLTQDIIDRIGKDSTYFSVVEDDRRKNTLIFFGSPTNNSWNDHWQMEPGFTLLVPFFKSGDKRVEYMGAGHCLSWPAYQLERLGTIKYRGFEFNVPNRPRNWIKYYFGKGWEIEDLEWHWNKARNLTHWGGGELCL